MVDDIEYSPRERFWLWTLAVFGFAVVNGAFVYGLLFQPGAIKAAVTNPIAAAFMLEAIVLMGILAYLLAKWRVSRLSWGWFIFLSLVGSMTFSIPVMALFARRDGQAESESTDRT